MERRNELQGPIGSDGSRLDRKKLAETWVSVHDGDGRRRKLTGARSVSCLLGCDALLFGHDALSLGMLRFILRAARLQGREPERSDRDQEQDRRAGEEHPQAAVGAPLALHFAL